jgi:hypothetical protein
MLISFPHPPSTEDSKQPGETEMKKEQKKIKG